MSLWLHLLAKKLILYRGVTHLNRISGKGINKVEGFRRLAMVFRWIGYSLAALCFMVGIFWSGGSLTGFLFCLVFGLFFIGAGKTISWVLLGFTKNI